MDIIRMPKYFTILGKHLRITILTLLKLVKNNKNVIGIDFSELLEMQKGDLMVLTAQIEKSMLYNNNQFYRVGRLPKNKKIVSLLMSTNQMYHINKTIISPDLSDSEKESLLLPKIVDSIVNDLKKIGIHDYYTPFYDFLTELIGNAVEHGIENKKINWWLTHEIDRNAKFIKYTFVDMGLGIINSHKKAGLPLKYRFLRNKHIVLDALHGILGSSTKEINRGKGLPQLHGMIEKEFVGNLVLVTNGVSLRYISGAFLTSVNPNFIGTYYSWSIDHNNYQKWKNTK